MGSGAERGNSPPLSDADIEAVEGPLAAVVGLINASTARLVDLVALALETGVWQQAGIRSPEHWLAWKAGVSPRRAGRLVATARRQAELPVTAAAFATGSLSEDQVTEVALHVPAAHDAEVAALATQTTVTQLRKVARGYAFDPAPEPTDQPPPAPTPQDVADRNRVRFGFGDDQRWHLHADLDAELGALVERALQASRDADEGQASGRVTWADALVRLSDAALVGLAGGRPAGERHQVIVHVRADRPEAPSHLHLGPAVPAAVRRLLSCDSTVRYLLEDAEGVPIKLGRRQRTVSAALRVLVEDRHHGTCARPGCTRSRGLHIHHLHHWEDGGATDPDNLAHR